MEHIHTATTAVVEAHSHATMRWSAIIGGWLVATGIASLMYVAGSGYRLHRVRSIQRGPATAKGIGTGTAIWMILTWAVSLFLGGMFASWFDGRADQTVGTLHGVTVWGLSVAASGLLLAVGLTQFVQGGAAIVKGGAMVGAAAAGMAAPPMAQRGQTGPMDDAITGLQAQVTQRVAQTSARSAPGSSLVVPASPAPAAPAPTAGAVTSPPASQSSGKRCGRAPCGRPTGSSDHGRGCDRADEGQHRKRQGFAGGEHIAVAGRNRSDRAGSFGAGRQVQSRCAGGR